MSSFRQGHKDVPSNKQRGFVTFYLTKVRPILLIIKIPSPQPSPKGRGSFQQTIKFMYQSPTKKPLSLEAFTLGTTQASTNSQITQPIPNPSKEYAVIIKYTKLALFFFFQKPISLPKLANLHHVNAYSAKSEIELSF